MVTALTAQSTTGVEAVLETPAAHVAATIAALEADLPPAAVKTGALGERSPAPATAAAALWFQSQGQRQWHCCGARETAQALQHGCGEDCSRSASLAALARTIASAALAS